MADDASDLRGLPAGTAHCRLEEVVGYRAGELPPERAGAFEDHLRICPACRRLVRDAVSVLSKIDTTVRSVESKASEVDQIVAGLRRKVVARAIRPANRRTNPGPRQPSQRFWLPAAGVVAVVVLVAVLQLLAVLLPRRWRSAHAAAAASSQPVAGSAAGPPAP